MKRLRSPNILFLILLLAFSAFVWRLLPSQGIRGDGFVYLISQTQQEFFSRKYFYTGFELSAAVLGWLLPKLYGMNISWYWWTAYIVMLVTNTLFYALAMTIVKKPYLAFIASLLFAINYFGNWGIYSSHCYCFFLERIIPVLFLLPAAIFLHRFLERVRRRDAFVSFILYFWGIGIGHWSIFVTAFFLFYPIFWVLFPAKGRRLPRVALLGGAYLGITVFFVLIQRIHESGFAFRWDIFDYFLHPTVYLWPEQIVRQFVHWTQYPAFLGSIFSAGLVGRIYDQPAIRAVTPYVVATYVVATILIYRSRPKWRALLAATIFATISIFYVNAFFGQYDVLYQPGANRYLYYPNMLLSLFWTMFVDILVVGRRRLLKGIAVMVLVGYVVVNAKLIHESYVESMGHNAWTKRVYEYIQTHAPSAARGTLIVAPYDEVGVYESIFFTEQLASKGVRVMSAYTPYKPGWEDVATKSSAVVMLEKDKACGCIREKVLK